MEKSESAVAGRAVCVVDAILEGTPLPHSLARLTASYEVNTSLRHTIRTIEAGRSVAEMFS